MKTINVTMWECSSCGYRQDFAPSKEAHDLHFNNNSKYPSERLEGDECPSCHLKGISCKGIVEVKDEKTQRVVLEEEDRQKFFDLIDTSKKEDGETDEAHIERKRRAKEEAVFFTKEDIEKLA